MAVVFTEGFDYYNGVGTMTSTTVGAATRWNYASGSMVAGRFGGQAYSLPTASNVLIYARLPASYNSGCVGFAFNGTGGNSNNSYAIFGVSSAGPGNTNFAGSLAQFRLNINTAGQVQILRGTTILATSTASIIFNVWNYIEVEFVISATVGEVRVYLNSDPIPAINISGINNKNETASGFEYIIFGAVPGTNGSFDDVYVTDTPTRLGEQRVVTSYPTSDVLTAFWSSSTGGAAPYTMIDETTCDADVTYVSSNTFNSRLVVGMPTLPVVPINVNAVQIVGFARKDETQFRQLALEYENTAGAVSTGASYTLGGSYTRMQNLYIENPLTAAPWTATDVNSMKIGARVIS